MRPLCWCSKELRVSFQLLRLWWNQKPRLSVTIGRIGDTERPRWLQHSPIFEFVTLKRTHGHLWRFHRSVEGLYLHVRACPGHAHASFSANILFTNFFVTNNWETLFSEGSSKVSKIRVRGLNADHERSSFTDWLKKKKLKWVKLN